MKKWECSHAEENGKYVGIIEFQTSDGEWYDFEIFETPDRIVFGGACNVGFIESGYMERDTDFSLNQNLETCLERLEEFYENGKDYENTELVLTERM